MIVSEQKSLAGKAARCNLVCLDENGKLVNTDMFNACYQVINHRLGIPFTHHSLRHTHATKLVEAGASIKAVQIRLGHKNIGTTMGTYVHHTDDMEQEAEHEHHHSKHKHEAQEIPRVAAHAPLWKEHGEKAGEDLHRSIMPRVMKVCKSPSFNGNHLRNAPF